MPRASCGARPTARRAARRQSQKLRADVLAQHPDVADAGVEGVGRNERYRTIAGEHDDLEGSQGREGRERVCSRGAEVLSAREEEVREGWMRRRGKSATTVLLSSRYGAHPAPHLEQLVDHDSHLLPAIREGVSLPNVKASPFRLSHRRS